MDEDSKNLILATCDTTWWNISGRFEMHCQLPILHGGDHFSSEKNYYAWCKRGSEDITYPRYDKQISQKHLKFEEI